MAYQHVFGFKNKLKETKTNSWFPLPGSKLENNFLVIMAFNNRKTPLGFKMTTFPMIISNPTPHS